MSAEARPDRETKARPGPESDRSAEGGRISAKGPPKFAHPVREAEIVALFARQYAVASIGQLTMLGLSARAVRDRAATGRLHRVHRGVYAVVQPALLGREARWLGAVLALGPGAVLSHRSAAALWGLRPTSPAVADVIAPRRRGREREGVNVHRDSLDQTDLTERRGIPCTSPRTHGDRPGRGGRAARG